MSFLLRQVAHCDVCGHEWIVVADKTPSHCAKCKSRKWNVDTVYVPKNPASSVDVMEAQAASRQKHADTCKCLMCKPPK